MACCPNGWCARCASIASRPMTPGPRYASAQVWRAFARRGNQGTGAGALRRQSGSRGRPGIHELLLLDDSLRRAIIEGRDANILHAMAVQGGMLSLYEDGLRKVA